MDFDKYVVMFNRRRLRLIIALFRKANKIDQSLAYISSNLERKERLLIKQGELLEEFSKGQEKFRLELAETFRLTEEIKLILNGSFSIE